ncbi:MAG: gamma-glutamylcyclotransferase family protein [Betaproteobacteria bacterium]|jgi:hypothetical protein
MSRTQTLAIASALALSIFAPAPSMADSGWWGHRLPDAPSQFIFGYGSLINSASRNATASKPTAAIPARISADFGYVRTWNDRTPAGFTALGLRKSRAGERASTINGVLYPVEGDDMARFDAREQGYVRVEVPADCIEPVSWQRLPEQGRIWIYVPVRPGNLPGEGLPEPDADFPLLESYIDVVIEGAMEYGAEYAQELIETTSDWSRYWLNDRELARRPWVHDGKYGGVDKLLAATQPAASHMGDRKFPERYAVHWFTDMNREHAR